MGIVWGRASLVLVLSLVAGFVGGFYGTFLLVYLGLPVIAATYAAMLGGSLAAPLLLGSTIRWWWP